jgi:hypothetical protein
MTGHRASCSCGSLNIQCGGEPIRTSVCHCLECRKRTGSAFSYNARFYERDVTIDGPSTAYLRRADSGTDITFHFCPRCGSTVFWRLASVPGIVAVAAGCFADPVFAAPRISVYEARKHGWAELAHIPGMEHVE